MSRVSDKSHALFPGLMLIPALSARKGGFGLAIDSFLGKGLSSDLGDNKRKRRLLDSTQVHQKNLSFSIKYKVYLAEKSPSTVTCSSSALESLSTSARLVSKKRN